MLHRTAEMLHCCFPFGVKGFVSFRFIPELRFTVINTWEGMSTVSNCDTRASVEFIRKI